MGSYAAKIEFKKQRAFKLFPDLNYDQESDEYFTPPIIAERLGTSKANIQRWYKEWKCLNT